MSFLSFNFAIFLGFILLIYHLASARWRPGLLLVFSYLFYASWSPVHALLLAAVTAGVYVAACRIEDHRKEGGKRAWMLLGVTALVLLLVAYKSAALLLKEFSPHSTAVVLIPIGLSYYLFKLIAYLLDVYWETIPAQRNVVTLALYTSFFPQIVSGPIQRAEDFFGQFDSLRHPDAAEFVAGLRRILFGLAKKILIADRLDVLTATVHAHPRDFSAPELLVAAYAYAIQIYADLSGLTDIAIGLGRLFGVKGPENFNLPFFSPNIQLFWRNWHMSLTSWLRDYLFTPLRMTFRNLGDAGLCLALLFNFIAVGVWHGINFQFLAFGVINGLFVSVSVLTLKRRNVFYKSHPALERLRAWIAPIVTFHLFVFSLIFFRADSFGSALHYLAGLVPGGAANTVAFTRFNFAALGISALTLCSCFAAFLISDLITWAMRQPAWAGWFFARPVLVRRGVYGAAIVVVLCLFKGTVNFIYARF